MDLPKGPIEIIGEVKIGESVFIRSQQNFYGLKYNVSQCGHIEKIKNDIAIIDWHHGVAPKEKIEISKIQQHLIK